MAITPYEQYLNLPSLMALQSPATPPSEPTTRASERHFIVVHQVAELLLSQLLLDLNAIRDVIDKEPGNGWDGGESGDQAAVRAAQRAEGLTAMLVHNLALLDHLPPDHFDAFRPRLGEASAGQSPQFARLFAIVHDAVSQLQPKSKPLPPQAARSVREIHHLLGQWQTKHLEIVKRMIGDAPGTGGTSGIGFLRDRIRHHAERAAALQKVGGRRPRSAMPRTAINTLQQLSLRRPSYPSGRRATSGSAKDPPLATARAMSSRDDLSADVGRMGSRTVLVTGGSSGIGTAVARAMAAQGDQVWITYHRAPDRAHALIGELPTHDLVRHRAFPLDQGCWTRVNELVDRLPGPVDVLINNAAVGSKTVEAQGGGSQPREDELFMRINALGPLWLTKLLLPGMLERGYGKIVMVSSVGGGITAFPTFREADEMSKAAVAFMTRQLAAQLTHSPVDVYCVCPGATDTPMFHASTLNNLSPSARHRLINHLPAGRLIDPSEIAHMIRWLASPQGEVLHGAVIDASLGLGAHPGLLTGPATA
ncbi:SDR family oxidoreductase [Actinomadura sp. KC216]|uniref:SDR family oxidoreductase n=1 Tax=Actinomadura sp. KC216 TaxID=2530370 RepID=UPI0010433E98|nr:SDR family NAD(P)-dependent oxidoreductase [Actinomadura sp. KC216]TDB91207.1 SDR family oxidoreductase [Actinomadura sp. KC216]